MNPEDRIRQLMEENAMLRAQLEQANPYAAADAAPLSRPPQGMYEEEDLLAEYERSLQPPTPYMQKMPHKAGKGSGPYLKKMPHKEKSGSNTPYLRKM
jgi:hypothetical protein